MKKRNYSRMLANKLRRFKRIFLNYAEKVNSLIPNGLRMNHEVFRYYVKKKIDSLLYMLNLSSTYYLNRFEINWKICDFLN